jgi:hypothetical protein
LKSATDHFFGHACLICQVMTGSCASFSRLTLISIGSICSVSVVRRHQSITLEDSPVHV